MIFDLISLLMSLVFSFLFIIGIVYLILFLAKERFIKIKRRREIHLIDKVQKKIKSILKRIWDFFIMLIIMMFSAIIGIGLKPFIYKLNYPLGEGYANFASYIIAIGIYLLLNPKKSN